MNYLHQMNYNLYKNEVKNYIKLIRSSRSDKTGSLRFNEEMVQIADGKNIDTFVKEILANKN